jgi:hypothetical protein
MKNNAVTIAIAKRVELRAVELGVELIVLVGGAGLGASMCEEHHKLFLRPARDI